jgi:hypothetical protein
MITNCQKEKKETTQFMQLCKTSERIIIYISLYLQRKTRRDPQNRTKQTRHSWRIGRQKWEGNEMRKKKRDRDTERKLPKKKRKNKQTTRKEGRNAMQES